MLLAPFRIRQHKLAERARSGEEEPAPSRFLPTRSLPGIQARDKEALDATTIQAGTLRANKVGCDRHCGAGELAPMLPAELLVHLGRMPSRQTRSPPPGTTPAKQQQKEFREPSVASKSHASSSDFLRCDAGVANMTAEQIGTGIKRSRPAQQSSPI